MFIVLCDNFNFCFWPDPWAEPFGIKYGNGLSSGLFLKNQQPHIKKEIFDLVVKNHRTSLMMIIQKKVERFTREVGEW